MFGVRVFELQKAMDNGFYSFLEPTPRIRLTLSLRVSTFSLQLTKASYALRYSLYIVGYAVFCVNVLYGWF